MKTPQKPEPVIVGNLRARIHAGPHPDDASLPAASQRWKWRVWRGDDALSMLGWYVRADVDVAVAERFTISRDSVETKTETFAGTVGALCDAYIAHMQGRADVRPSTKHGARRNLGHVRDALGAVRVGQVNAATLEKYKNDRLNSGAASRTVRQELSALGTAWKWGASDGRSYSTRTRLSQPKLEIHATRAKDTPSAADVDAVIAAMPWTWPRVLLSCIRYTGARRHEIAALWWSDLDLDGDKGRGIMAIPGDPDPKSPRATKTGARTIKIPAALVAVLKKWATLTGADVTADVSVLGVTRGSAVAAVGAYLDDGITAAGVHRFTCHGVRRMTVQGFRRAGVPVATAASYLGHSVEEMIRAYEEVTEDDHSDALDLVEAAASKSTRARRPRAAVGTLPEA